MYVMDRDFAYYLFRDAGLKDICIEAGIVAEGSINGSLMVNTTIVLSGSTGVYMKHC